MRRRIAVVTGTRAEYGLLEPLVRLIRRDPALELQLIVTGSHLSARLGMTVREIERDGHPIAARVPLGLRGDGPLDVAKAMAAGVKGLATAFTKLKPHIIVLLGDRYEVLSAASAALPLRIPVAHLHGGEASEGVLDESIRHAVTKLSHLHFAAFPVYARRLRMMGEDPRRVFCFGSPGADRLASLTLLSRGDLSRELGLPLASPLGVVTYHPATLSSDGGLGEFDSLLAAVSTTPGTWIFTYPNADAGNASLVGRIKAFVKRNPRPSAAFPSLGQRRYLSLLRHADVMAGNSSSGLLEAPYFRLPVVNVGNRQQGRLRAPNVIDVPQPTPSSLSRALRQALSEDFRKGIPPSPAPRHSPSRRILEVLKTVALGEDLLKKRLHG